MGDEIIRALDGISFSIEEGEFVAIVGPSGCGKSTLMNILGLLDQPETGQYLLDKISAGGLNDTERAQLRNQKIGFVFQNFQLLSRATARRNVELPLVYCASYGKKFTPKEMKEQALGALSRVNLTARSDHKPNELSGGQRQRVAIARALINNPRLLLADEPTGNLDSKSGAEILALFQELNSTGVTVILVTHDPQIAERAKHTIVMSDGKIVSDIKRGP